MAQLVEQSLLTPKVRSSNPVILQLLLNQYFSLNFCRKGDHKEKDAGNGPFEKTNNLNYERLFLGKADSEFQSWVVCSVTRCLKCLANIWPFTT